MLNRNPWKIVKLTRLFYGCSKCAVLEADEMVRFQRRWASKRYKGKKRRYPIYSVNFPTELNEKVEAKRQKDYTLNWTEQETDQQEKITLTFTRNKQQTPK